MKFLLARLNCRGSDMKDIRTITENILLEIGANPGNKGFSYTVTAMEVIKEDVEYLNCRMRLYTEIACKHNTTALRVERAIRHEKEKIMAYQNLKAFEKYFGVPKMKFTNSELLGTLYVRINQILREEENHAN